MSEEFERKERQLERLELITSITSNISLLVTLFVFVTLAGQLLGINMGYIWYLIVTFHWVVPEWFIEKYYSVWYLMTWALLLLMLWDSIYQNRYVAKHGHPNAHYAYYSTIAMFLLSFFLAVLFRFGIFEFLAAISGVTLAYLTFAPPSSEEGGAATW